MAANKFGFTKQRLEALKPSEGKRMYVYDAKTEGLAIAVLPSGGKVFYVYKWHGGKPVRLRLGMFPTMSVEAARKASQKAVASMASGIDPQAAKRATRHEQTLQGLWEYWLDCARTGRDRKDNKPKKQKSIDEDERLYKQFLKVWGSRRLSSITLDEVKQLHQKIGKKNGHYIANRMLALFRSMYNKAGGIGYTGTNPGGTKQQISPFAEKSRDRFVTGDELPAFFQALFAEPNCVFRDFVLLALFVGARVSDVLAMRWCDVDVAMARWRIPDSKTGVTLVPLVPQAVAILKARHEANGKSPWVFPAIRRNQCGHLTYPQRAWQRLCDRAGLDDLRIHDIRRSLGSHMASINTSETIIGKMLGHRPGSKATSVYARLGMDAVRTAAESAVTAMLSYAGAKIDDVGGVVIDVKAKPVS